MSTKAYIQTASIYLSSSDFSELCTNILKLNLRIFWQLCKFLLLPTKKTILIEVSNVNYSTSHAPSERYTPQVFKIRSTTLQKKIPQWKIYTQVFKIRSTTLQKKIPQVTDTYNSKPENKTRRRIRHIWKETNNKNTMSLLWRLLFL